MSQYSVNRVSHNMRVKWYPGEEKPAEVLVFSRDLFRESGWEEVSKKNKCSDKRTFSEAKEGGEASAEKTPPEGRGWIRARRRAYDLIRSNPGLNAFITLTLSADEVDRTDYKAIIQKLNVWLDNRVRRSDLRYVIVPEYHHDGKAIHFHGLASAEGLKLVDSGHKRKGKTVYNIGDFPLGFTTAILVTGAEASVACAGYIFKYMTKMKGVKIGGRYFLHGGKLAEPEVYYFDVDFCKVKLPGREISFCAGAEIKSCSGADAEKLLADLGVEVVRHQTITP